MQSRNPVTVRTFGLAGRDRASHEPYRYGMIFWEQYDPLSRGLTTTCQYQTIGKSGAVEHTYYRVLHQRVHANSEIQAAAERGGSDLLGHNMQSRQGVSCDIGGELSSSGQAGQKHRDNAMSAPEISVIVPTTTGAAHVYTAASFVGLKVPTTLSSSFATTADGRYWRHAPDTWSRSADRLPTRTRLSGRRGPKPGDSGLYRQRCGLRR